MVLHRPFEPAALIGHVQKADSWFPIGSLAFPELPPVSCSLGSQGTRLCLGQSSDQLFKVTNGQIWRLRWRIDKSKLVACYFAPGGASVQICFYISGSDEIVTVDVALSRRFFPWLANPESKSNLVSRYNSTITAKHLHQATLHPPRAEQWFPLRHEFNLHVEW